jgi:hypothetical protein
MKIASQRQLAKTKAVHRRAKKFVFSKLFLLELYL